MGYLNSLVGKTITDILVSQGVYYPIRSDKSEDEPSQVVEEIILKTEDYSLTISNRVKLNPAGENIKSLKGCKIIFIHETDLEVSISTSDKKTLIIDLRDEAYYGPEAMCLLGPDNLVVVWN